MIIEVATPRSSEHHECFEIQEVLREIIALVDEADIDVHLQFPDTKPIEAAHTFASRAERIIAEAVGQNADITTHLEPENDTEE